MRQLLKTLLVAAGVTVVSAAPAAAQANLSLAGTTSATATVGFHFFNVTTAGLFDIFTTSATGTSGVTPFDPVIALFRGTAATGPLVGLDDDSCPISQCGRSIAYSNALIDNVFLGVGNYTLAITDYPYAESIFRAGSNPWATRFGGYMVRVNSSAALGHGQQLGQAVAVPEPASAVLVISGLLGLAAAARRRRRA